MKILKGAIPSLASEGQITLQIPEFDVGGPHPEFEEVEDCFVWLLSSKNVPVVGKEQGCLFLSEIGWNRYKDEIKEAFEKSTNPRGTWLEFEEYVESFFEDVKSSIVKEIDRLDKSKEKIDNKIEKLFNFLK